MTGPQSEVFMTSAEFHGYLNHRGTEPVVYLKLAKAKETQPGERMSVISAQSFSFTDQL